MDLAHSGMLVHELLNEDPDMVPKEDPLIVLDIKFALFIVYKSGLKFFSAQVSKVFR